MRTVDKPAELLGDLAAKAGVSAKIRNALTAAGVSPDTANKLAPALGQSKVNDASNAAQYDAAYGKSTSAGLGNVIGQTAVIAPLISTGGALAGAGATGLAAGVADSAPIASKIIQGGANLLSGTAGAGMEGIAGGATRLASKVA
ncbi:hypothetical protein EAH75_01490 [Rhodanobacter glycinis]|nr:hypothetical protein EAH75_01490 [Rhodanobacter glycinis]